MSYAASGSYPVAGSANHSATDAYQQGYQQYPFDYLSSVHQQAAYSAYNDWKFQML